MTTINDKLANKAIHDVFNHLVYFQSYVSLKINIRSKNYEGQRSVPTKPGEGI